MAAAAPRVKFFTGDIGEDGYLVWGLHAAGTAVKLAEDHRGEPFATRPTLIEARAWRMVGDTSGEYSAFLMEAHEHEKPHGQFFGTFVTTSEGPLPDAQDDGGGP